MPNPTAPAAPAANPMVKAGVVGVIGLALGFVVGWGVGRVSTGTPVNPISTAPKGGTYQEGYDAAKKKLADSGLFPAAPTETHALGGSVVSVDGGSFVLAANVTSPNPLDDINAPKERTVTVTADTKITRQTMLSPDEQQKAFANYQKTVQALKPGETPPPVPMPFKLDAIKLSDLKAGDVVSVTSADNILTAATFTATEVSLSGQAPTPAPTPAPAPGQ